MEQKCEYSLREKRTKGIRRGKKRRFSEDE